MRLLPEYALLAYTKSNHCGHVLMNTLIRWIVSALIFLVAASVVPGIVVASFWTALLVALLWGIIGVTLKPILVLLTLPINILTLGLFTFVINAIFLLLISALLDGFEVAGFGTALLGALVIALLQWVADRLFGID
jgi:putative membrane protein